MQRDLLLSEKVGDAKLEPGLVLAGMRAISALKLRTTLTGLQKGVLVAD
jgi:hypothetical protein